MRIRNRLLLGAVAVLLASSTASAQTLAGEALLNALRKGGYVIVMRHARSPANLPDTQKADPGNTRLERQLDEEGRVTATAMGRGIRDRTIPIGEVLTSPTYRARETVRLAGWTNAMSVPELGDNGQGMQQVVPDAQAAWLRNRVTRTPARGNAVLVTHAPNLNGAFQESAAGMEDGEALIFAPDGKGGAAVVARIKIDEWAQLGR